LIAIAVLLVGVLAAPRAASSQPPDKFENLQVLPKDISRDALTQRMREFSFALGVRCQYCHEGGDGVSFQGVVFSSDAKPAKRNARVMLRMVDTLNTTTLPQMPSRHQPAVTMDCVICHRGLPVPKTLQTELTEVIATRGIPAAVERYRVLRRDTLPLGLFRFDEWTMNEVARSLTESGNTDAAIAMLELNAEFYPKSADIDFGLGELHRKRGERDKAIARYRMALEKRPDYAPAKKQLDELLAKGGDPHQV
jgi:tetratricopeptide (TPR) repeat protein